MAGPLWIVRAYRAGEWREFSTRDTKTLRATLNAEGWIITNLTSSFTVPDRKVG